MRERRFHTVTYFDGCDLTLKKRKDLSKTPLFIVVKCESVKLDLSTESRGATLVDTLKSNYSLKPTNSSPLRFVANSTLERVQLQQQNGNMKRNQLVPLKKVLLVLEHV
ncbi:hypothetical protein J6590_101429 [Homalodisca vitripennis]|nr:hypothetical protein J6590_101429 [Homalodisca vitripennis]